MRKIYFIGIGGIGMSALARWFKFNGHEVSGYDRTPSTLTQALSEEGIAVHYEDRPDLIPKEIDDTLVFYTPAIPESLGEYCCVKEKGYKADKSVYDKMKNSLKSMEEGNIDRFIKFKCFNYCTVCLT